jgi:dimethylargininase
MILNQAIVRPPGANFADGLTSSKLGKPNPHLALEQHAAYCRALENCGLNLTELEPDIQYPDSTFVEDTAILTSRMAVLTRPGTSSRRGEVSLIKPILSHFYPYLYSIQHPGTLDGGDICQTGEHFFIGLSERTNEHGAKQLVDLLEQDGFSSSIVDIRGVDGLLHLKSGIAYLGDRRLILIDSLLKLSTFRDFEIITVDPDENYAANCLKVNDFILLAAGYPKLEQKITGLGFPLIPLEMTEFQKMDGGLSCLSLRF